MSLLPTACLPSLAEAAAPEVVFATASGAVVVVEAQDAAGDVRTQGSGVVVAPGLIVTNFHVVRDGKSFVVRQVGRKQSASVVTIDARRDLSLLRVKDTRLTPITMRASASLRVGERVYTIGAPEGLELSLSEGVVSAIRQVSDDNYIQTSAAISHGSSGGGLFDSTGRLVGITTFTIVKGQNLNFAIPTERVTALLDGEAAGRGKSSSASGGLSAAVPSQAELSADDSYRGAFELVMLAISQVRPGNEAVAKETLLEAVRIRPDFGPAWSALAYVQLALGDLPGGLASAQEDVRLSPNSWEAWKMLSSAFMKSKRFDEAGHALDEALKRKPSELSLLIESANLLYVRGNLVGAIAACRKLVSSYPDEADAWLVFGYAQRAHGDSAEARSSFNQAIRISPNSARAWAELGKSYVKDKRPADAIEPYQRAQKLEPNWPVPCVGLSRALNNAERIRDARSQCLVCVEKFPLDGDALYMLGIVHCRLGERDALFDVHERLRRINAKYADELFHTCMERR